MFLNFSNSFKAIYLNTHTNTLTVCVILVKYVHGFLKLRCPEFGQFLNFLVVFQNSGAARDIATHIIQLTRWTMVQNDYAVIRVRNGNV